MKRHRWVLYSFIIIILLVIVSSFLYYYFIIKHPGEHISKEYILSIISEESPVYYRDGINKIGVFFDKDHRMYVHTDDVPKDFINALLAAEDKNFYNHMGVDFSGILRAIWINIRAGKIKAGGSTLTQQTAKNIFGRRGRDWVSKFKELINALKLEAHFTKDEILEFYINQFYVNGNGRGLGIAARYFFDKHINDLTLLESASLAGIVKGPNYYNPFIGDTEEERARMRKKVKIRTAYVLKNMKRLSMIGEDVYNEEIDREIPFKKGIFRFEQNVVLDYVRNILQAERFTKILNEKGIYNPATAGLKIFTTIDKGIQEAALYGVKKNLSELGIILDGLDIDDLKFNDREIKPNTNEEINSLQFYYGKIIDIKKKKRPGIVVDIGGIEGIIDSDSIRRIANLIKKGKRKNMWAKATQKDVNSFIKGLKKNDILYASIRDIDRKNNKVYLDIDAQPTLQGGMVILEKGEIRAMVGGEDNKNYNRAAQAVRQFGSTFKPLIYYAALQLGWNNLDKLGNYRNLFPFENILYFPRPYHKDAPEEVSMLWAGVKSENIASVYLLYHLTDKLTFAQLKGLAERLGLLQEPHEVRNEYVKRIRDRLGIVSNKAQRRRGIFNEIKEGIKADLLFDGKFEEALNLSRLYYGIGFDKEIKYYENLIKKGIGDAEEHLLRIDILKKYSFLNLQKTAHTLNETAFNDDDLISGMLSPGTIRKIEEAINERLLELRNHDPYSIDVLYRNMDFRILLGMKYVIALTQKIGVNSPIGAVLSMPMGSNSITLLEAAMIYQTLLEGNIYRFSDSIKRGETAAIIKILDRDNTIVYQYKPITERISDEKDAYLIGRILYNVVRYGTGQMARGKVLLSSLDPEKNKELKMLHIEYPLYGKTGTTNSYSNAAFIGFIPYVTTQARTLEYKHSLTVATYVGYDDNRSMAERAIRITGASGALPAWSITAKEIVIYLDQSRFIDAADLAFSLVDHVPIKKPKDIISVPVNKSSGLRVAEEFYNMYTDTGKDDGIVFIESFEIFNGKNFEGEKHFEPFKE